MIKNKLKKIAILGIFFLLIGVSILPSVSSTNITIKQYVKSPMTVIKVDDDGDGDYTSIQDAVDNATNGDTIEVYSGTYMETNIRADKQLILQGIDSELGGGSGTGKPLIITDEDDKELIIVKADGCSISGFHLKTTGCCSSGIVIEGSDYNNIYQNDVEDINFGIHLSHSSYNRVYENNARYTFYGILISNSHNNQVYKNNIDENGYGIELGNFAVNNTIFQNTVKNVDAGGIHFCRTNNNTIYENIITGCDTGILFGEVDEFGIGMTIYSNKITSCSEGILVRRHFHKIYQNNITNCKYGILMEKIETLPPIPCCANKVYENNIIDSRETGIWLKGVYTSEIYRNNITGSEDEGLYLTDAEINNIFENNITNNRYGFYSWYSENNIIYHNNFIGNHNNAYSYGSPTDRRNTWNLPLTKNGGGNYWDDYNGKDRNGDNVGDIPYFVPDSDFNLFNNDVDRYPLMEPNGRPNVKIKSISKQIYSNQLSLRLIERFPILWKVFLCLILR